MPLTLAIFVTSLTVYASVQMPPNIRPRYIYASIYLHISGLIITSLSNDPKHKNENWSKFKPSPKLGNM